MNQKAALLLLPIFLLILSSTNASKASVCKGLHFNMTVFHTKTNLEVFRYSADISLSVADSIHTVITMNNHSYWSLNESIYYQYSPPQYQDVEQGVIRCKNNTGLCKLTVFDSAGWYEVPLKLQRWVYVVSFTDFLIFDQGTVYMTDGSFFDPVQVPCAEAYELEIEGPPFNSIFDYCCTEFAEIEVPDKVSTTCVEFDGNTTFYAKSGVKSTTFSAKYLFNSGVMKVTVQDHNLPKGTFFDLLPNNGGTGCLKQSGLNCTFTREIYKYQDYQYDMFLTIFDMENIYGTTIAGKILSRNGVLVRHENKPYTPRDPCWIRHFPSNDGGRALNSFCCMKFKNQTTIFDTMGLQGGANVQKGMKKLVRKGGRKNKLLH